MKPAFPHLEHAVWQRIAGFARSSVRNAIEANHQEGGTTKIHLGRNRLANFCQSLNCDGADGR